MKVSLNWIKEFVDITMSAGELVEKIGAQLGAVEEVIHLEQQYQDIIVVKVVVCEKHPNADKLSLCLVDDNGAVKNVERNKDGLVQVVCGAPNVKAGMLAAWLPPGSTVPASYDKEPFVLEARELRGKISNGMLASASELALSDDHSGIVELSFGEPGEDFAALTGLNDTIIDIENKMFTHRPDCFGILGVAREIAGITGQQFTSPAWYTQTPDTLPAESKLTVSVSNTTPELVPRFMAQPIEDIAVKTSPVWLQSYLVRSGIRPVNNIVDVTNYVMYLTGQPLHAYDYDKLCKVAGTETAQLETRLSRKGDKLKLLNGKTLTIEDDKTILITTNDIPVGIGGVMGGADTEVDEHTKKIVVECASFDMYAIRGASMRHGLFTDAVTRFNKGQSNLQNSAVLHKSSGWMTQLGGGKIGKTLDLHKTLRRPIAVHVTAEFINSRLGLNLKINDMAQLLKNVEFDVAINGPTLAVKPPFWRTDIEIAEDIVEEVGRLYGFDNLSLALPSRSMKPAPTNPVLELKAHIRRTLSMAGANELYSYSFVHGNLLDVAHQDKKKAYKLSNAISPDLHYYRLSLTPSLLERIHANSKAGFDEFALYEMGKSHNKTHLENEENGLPRELQKLALVLAADDKLKKPGSAYYQAQRYLQLLMNELQIVITLKPITKPLISQTAQPFERSRSAEIVDTDNGETIGIIGEFKADVRRKLKLPTYCAGFELSTGKLLPATNKSAYEKLSKYPSISQDICLRSAQDVTYAELESTVHEALKDTPEHTDVQPIDIYQKDGSDKKQTTFRLTVTSHERTLTDDYVGGLLQNVTDLAARKLKTTRI